MFEKFDDDVSEYRGWTLRVKRSLYKPGKIHFETHCTNPATGAIHVVVPPYDTDHAKLAIEQGQLHGREFVDKQPS